MSRSSTDRGPHVLARRFFRIPRTRVSPLELTRALLLTCAAAGAAGLIFVVSIVPHGTSMSTLFLNIFGATAV